MGRGHVVTLSRGRGRRLAVSAACTASLGLVSLGAMQPAGAATPARSPAVPVSASSAPSPTDELTGGPLGFVDAVPTPDGQGLWAVTDTGAVEALGDANFYGDTSRVTLDAPIVGIAATSDGGGYWLLGADGGIFSFGDAQYFGSTGTST
jgi:hypothetical protein